MLPEDLSRATALNWALEKVENKFFDGEVIVMQPLSASNEVQV